MLHQQREATNELLEMDSFDSYENPKDPSGIHQNTIHAWDKQDDPFQQTYKLHNLTNQIPSQKDCELFSLSDFYKSKSRSKKSSKKNQTKSKPVQTRTRVPKPCFDHRKPGGIPQNNQPIRQCQIDEHVYVKDPSLQPNLVGDKTCFKTVPTSMEKLNHVSMKIPPYGFGQNQNVQYMTSDKKNTETIGYAKGQSMNQQNLHYRHLSDITPELTPKSDHYFVKDSLLGNYCKLQQSFLYDLRSSDVSREKQVISRQNGVSGNAKRQWFDRMKKVQQRAVDRVVSQKNDKSFRDENAVGLVTKQGTGIHNVYRKNQAYDITGGSQNSMTKVPYKYQEFDNLVNLCVKEYGDLQGVDKGDSGENIGDRPMSGKEKEAIYKSNIEEVKRKVVNGRSEATTLKDQIVNNKQFKKMEQRRRLIQHKSNNSESHLGFITHNNYKTNGQIQPNLSNNVSMNEGNLVGSEIERNPALYLETLLKKGIRRQNYLKTDEDYQNIHKIINEKVKNVNINKALKVVLKNELKKNSELSKKDDPNNNKKEQCVATEENGAKFQKVKVASNTTTYEDMFDTSNKRNGQARFYKNGANNMKNSISGINRNLDLQLREKSQGSITRESCDKKVAEMHKQIPGQKFQRKVEFRKNNVDPFSQGIKGSSSFTLTDCLFKGRNSAKDGNSDMQGQADAGSGLMRTKDAVRLRSSQDFGGSRELKEKLKSQKIYDENGKGGSLAQKKIMLNVRRDVSK